MKNQHYIVFSSDAVGKMHNQLDAIHKILSAGKTLKTGNIAVSSDFFRHVIFLENLIFIGEEEAKPRERRELTLVKGESSNDQFTS